jgi:hypothetical protein
MIVADFQFPLADLRNERSNALKIGIRQLPIDNYLIYRKFSGS